MPLILFVMFIVVPILEIAVLIQVGQQIGTAPTIALLIGISLAGAILAKREGLAVWTRFQQTLQRGEIPSKEVADGALILFGAALLLTPGFLTDALGLVLLFPPSRATVRQGAVKLGSILAVRRFPIIGSIGVARSGVRKVKARTVRTGSAEPGDSGGDRDADHTTGQ